MKDEYDFSKAESFSEIKRLRKRIKELEEGSCRFKCRSQRDAFMAGFENGFMEGFWCEENPADPYEDCIDHPDKHYKQWLKEQREKEHTPST